MKETFYSVESARYNYTKRIFSSFDEFWASINNNEVCFIIQFPLDLWFKSRIASTWLANFVSSVAFSINPPTTFSRHPFVCLLKSREISLEMEWNYRVNLHSHLISPSTTHFVHSLLLCFHLLIFSKIIKVFAVRQEENEKMYFPPRASGRREEKNPPLVHDNKVSFFTSTHKSTWDGFSWNNIGKYVIKIRYIFIPFGVLFSLRMEMFQCWRECAPCRPTLRPKEICVAHA